MTKRTGYKKRTTRRRRGGALTAPENDIPVTPGSTEPVSYTSAYETPITTGNTEPVSYTRAFGRVGNVGSTAVSNVENVGKSGIEDIKSGTGKMFTGTKGFLGGIWQKLMAEPEKKPTQVQFGGKRRHIRYNRKHVTKKISGFSKLLKRFGLGKTRRTRGGCGECIKSGY